MFNWIKCLYQRPLRFRRTIILPLVVFIITTSFLYVLVEYYTNNKVEFSSSSSVSNSTSTNVTCKTDDLFQSVADEYCKEKLRNISCELQTNSHFYPESLPRFCPKHEGQFGDIVGCIAIRNISTLHTEQLSILDTEIQCIDYCLKRSLPYAAYNTETSRCYCSVEFPRHYRLIKSGKKCPAQTLNYDTIGQDISTLYRTGFAPFGNDLKKHPRSENDTDTVIVFFLTVGGRKSLRQIYRLIRSIYLSQHYYFIHVDQRDDYLQHELRKLPLKFPNIHVTEKRYPTTWGSSTLLNAHLDVFKEIFEELRWNFSFLINLSESDFPMKSVQIITDVLTVYRPYNFLGPHNQEPFRFFKAQAAFHTFLQCNNHMYKVKYRPLIKKIIYDGGSDWYILNRDFLHYITYGDDELINGLRHAFNYSLLPCEMFFHTLLSNSLYCDTYVRNNLRYVNWNRKRGCKCQHSNVVDWCGCSPLVYRLADKHSFISKRELPYFFARKFDPSIDESIIDWLDESISKKNLSNGAAYLQNLYHPIDGIEKLSAALKLFDLYARSKLVKYFQNENLQLEQVHAVFQSSVFRGYSLQYKSDQKEQIELLISLNSPHATLSNDVKRFETGSKFDVKELLFADRSRTFIEPNSIKILIEWEGTGSNDTTLIINTPNNTVVDRVELYSSDEPVVNDISLPKISDSSLIGVWQMSIVDDINGTQLASSDFLILSSSQEQSLVDSENLLSLAKFWSMSNICSTKVNSSSYSNHLFNGTIPVLTDCFQQPWSFFYFDIKINW